MKNLIIVLIFGIFFSLSACDTNQTDRGTDRKNDKEKRESDEQRDREDLDDAGVDRRNDMDTTARRDNDNDVNY